MQPKEKKKKQKYGTRKNSTIIISGYNNKEIRKERNKINAIKHFDF